MPIKNMNQKMHVIFVSKLNIKIIHLTMMKQNLHLIGKKINHFFTLNY